MIIIPIGHEELVLERLPFATIGIILLNVLVFLPTSCQLEKDAQEEKESFKELTDYFESHEYLDLPEEIVCKLPKTDREIYAARREWIKWFDESPAEVDEFIDEYFGDRMPRPGEDALKIAEALAKGRSPAGALKGIKKKMALSDDTKVRFVMHLKTLDPHQRRREQEMLSRLCEEFSGISESSIVNKLGYIPASPGIVTMITSLFLHVNIFHIVFNMLFLWLAACKLEDILGRFCFVAIYLFCGIVATVFHHTSHPESTDPVIGASGAVAGLMGYFLIRLTKKRIRFFYMYWLLRLMPKTGIFAAPAYIMLPLWFTGELFYALFFNIGVVAHWAHVGGFVGGVSVAVAFRLLRFEQRVLGRKPEVEVEPRKVPLIAFQPYKGMPPKNPQSPYSPKTVAASDSPTPVAASDPLKPVAAQAPAAPDVVSRPVSERQVGSADIHPQNLAALENLEKFTAESPVFLDLDLAGPATSLDQSKEVQPLRDLTPEPLAPLGERVFPALALAAPVENLDQEIEKYRPDVQAPQPPQRPEPVDVPPIAAGLFFERIDPKEITLSDIGAEHVEALTTKGEPLILLRDDISAVAIGRIDKIEADLANQVFPKGVPSDPAYILALVAVDDKARELGLITTFLVDGQKCRWKELLTKPRNRNSKNMVRLTTELLKVFKSATYVHGKGPLGPNNMPIYQSLDSFLEHLKKSAAK